MLPEILCAEILDLKSLGVHALIWHSLKKSALMAQLKEECIDMAQLKEECLF